MSFESQPNQDASASEIKNKREAFVRLFEETLSKKEEDVPVVEYNLPYPKEDFLRFLAEEKNVLLHGSSEKDIEIFEPRQANDAVKKSGNKKAVYGVVDPVLPIFYAIQDRSKKLGVVKSGVSENLETGELEYDFEISGDTLEGQPWTRGSVYIFDRDKFNPETDDNGGLSGEWTSENPVKPLAKLEVGPEDFRFINKVRNSNY